jgi:hypothetical protein
MAGNDESWIDSKRSMSADGRYIVFSSLATNLVEAALTDPLQAYLRDRQVGTTTLLNVTPAGTPANGKSGDASISANGRYVAFVSFATDLLPSGPVSQPGQIYVRDLQTDEIELVSQGTLGKLATSAFEHQAAVSDDGRWVAFETQSALNDPFETGPRRVFLRDRVAGLTHEVDVDSTGFPASGHARFGGMSRDGRAISFNHEEPLLPQDTLDDDDVYLYDRFEALPWSDLDQGLAGSLGLPVLAGAGTLGPTTISFIALARLLPGTTVFLIVGFSSVSLPFKGGLLVPTPTYLFPLPTGPGKLLLPVHMRSGVPSGVELIMQAWLADPAGPSGFAASNGLSGITP